MKRYWDKVNIRSLDECWEWNAATRGGYGSIKVDGKVVDAHRIMCEWAFGNLPKGIIACHHCDNKLCVNPLHIYPGTYKQNHADGINRGRIVLAKPIRLCGTEQCYNRGCRCSKCREAHRVYAYEKRHR